MKWKVLGVRKMNLQKLFCYESAFKLLLINEDGLVTIDSLRYLESV